nr:uncharacterized protein LOC111505187 isoform X2 [Leptinotarsa decemlineata]
MCVLRQNSGCLPVRMTMSHLKNDTDNLIKYKLVGGTLKLKPGVFPHKFDCQKGVKPAKERGPCEKRLREDYFQYSSENDVPSISNCQPFEVIQFDSIHEKSGVLEDVLSEDCSVNVPDNHKQKFKDKQVQVDIKVKQKKKKVQTILKRDKRNVAQNKGTMTIHSSVL